MAVMTYEEIRKSLLDETPVQFCVYLEMLEHRYKAQGFSSLRECLETPINKNGVGIEMSKVRSMLYYNPMYEHKAKKLETKLGIAEVAKSVDALNEHGGNRKQVYKNKNVNLKSKGGNSKEYRIAKLKRDHPEIAERLEAGEFKTVAEAERVAKGETRKPKQSVRLDGSNVSSSAEAIIEKFGVEFALSLADEILGQVLH